MFESVVAVLLNRVLGKYVEDLDTENLNVGIFSGNVLLTDLKLKPEALYELNLPIHVKIGVIGKLTLQISWAALYSSPICISIEDVLILAGPAVTRGEWGPADIEREKRLVRAAKKKILQDLEERGSEGEPVAEPNNFIENLITTIINNLQVFIRNIHIRYEDDIVSPLACGICVQGISIETTNSKWKPSPTPSGAQTAYQLTRIESLSLYWNPRSSKCSTPVAVTSPQHFYAWRNSMLRGLETFSMHDEDFEFLLKPISLKVKAIISRSTETRSPRLLVDAVLQDCAVQLTRLQVLSISRVRESFQRIAISRKYRKLKPGCDVHGNASKWWKFSLAAILEQRVRPYTWAGIKDHRTKFRQYKDTYKKCLMSPNDIELRLDLQQLEDALEITCIVIAREQAKIEIQQSDPEKIIVRENEVDGWWPFTLFTKSASNANIPENNEIQNVDLDEKSTTYELAVKSEKSKSVWSQLTSPERKRVCDIIANAKGVKPDKPKQYIEHKLNFTLGNCSLGLVSEGRELLVGALSQLLVSVETRPAAHGFKLSVRAESLVIEGCGKDSELAPLLSAAPSATHVASILLAFDLEKHPAHLKADYSICGTLEQVEMVYNEQAISELLYFFQETPLQPQQIEHMAQERLAEVKIIGKSLLAYLKSRKTLIYINLDIKSPCLVIPEFGSLQKGGNLLILDLGRVSIKSDLQEPDQTLDDVTSMELEERLYDRLHADVSAFQVLFCDSGEEWRESSRNIDSDLHLISKVRAQLVFSNSIRPDYIHLPVHKLNLSISSLKLNLSDRKIGLFLGFLDNLPLPIKYFSEVDSKKTTDSLCPFLLKDLIKTEPSYKHLKSIKSKMVRNSLLKAQQKYDEFDKGAAKSAFMENHKSFLSSEVSEEEELCARAVDLPGFEDNISPHNNITVLMRFLIGEVVLALARSHELTDKPYLMIRLGKLCLDTALMQYGPAVQISLQGIVITDKLHVGSQGEYLELLSTGQGEDAATLLYRKVRADCPDFKSHCHSVEHSVVLDVSFVSFLLHREAVAMLEKYLRYLAKKVLSREHLITRITPHLSALDWIWGRGAPPDPPIPPGATKFSYAARLSKLQVKLCDADRELIGASLTGLESECIFKANERMVLRFSLDGLTIDDLQQNTLYTKLLTVDEDRVLEVKYVRHAPRLYAGPFADTKEAEDNVKADGSLRVYIGKLHATLLYKTVVDIQQFIEPFIPVGTIARAANTAGKSLEDTIHTAKHSPIKLHLSIEIHAPTFLMPQKSGSSNLLVVNMGDLSVENFFKTQSSANQSPHGGSSHIVDNILVRLQSVSLSRAVMTLPGILQIQEPILDPLSLRLDIKRAVAVPMSTTQVPIVGASFSTPLQFDINVIMDTIHIHIGQRDLSTIFAVWCDNFAEGYFLGSSSAFIGSPLEQPSPSATSDDAAVKKLEAFFSQSESVRKTGVIRFSLDGLQLTLFSDLDELLSSPVREISRGLCLLEIGEVTGHLYAMSDNSMEAELALQSCRIEDVRTTARDIKNIFESHTNIEDDLESSPISVSVPPLLDISWKQTPQGDCSIHATVESTRLNLSVGFIMHLLTFIYDALPGDREGGVINHGYTGETPRVIRAPRVSSSAGSTSGYFSNGASWCEDCASITVSLQLRKPEIRIYPEKDVKNCVLVLKSEISVDFARQPNREALGICISGLQLLSCSQDAKGLVGPPNVVLWPCDIEFCRNFKTCENGIQISACFSQIKLCVIPETVYSITDILDDIMNSLNNESEIESMVVPSQKSDKLEPEDLWSPKQITPLLYTDSQTYEYYNKPSYPEASKTSETFKICVPSIEIRFMMNTNFPVLLVTSKLDIAAFDWSKQMHAKGEFNLQVSVFNNKVGNWEPVIEPVAYDEDIFTPWGVIFKMFQAKSYPMYSKLQQGTEIDSGPRSSCSIPSKRKRAESETSADESEAAMTFIRCPEDIRSTIDTYGAATEESDSENEEGDMEKLASAVGHLFTGDSSDEEHNCCTSGAESYSEMSQAGSQAKQLSDAVESEISESDHNALALPDSVDSGLCNNGSVKFATYVIMDSKDRLNITLTPQSISLMTNLFDVLMRKVNGLPFEFDRNLELVNEIWPHAKAEVISRHNSSEQVIVSAECEAHSRPSTPDSDAELTRNESEEGRNECSLEISNCPPEILMDFPTPSITDLYKQITDEKLKIQVEGFDSLQITCPTREVSKLHLLQPQKHSTDYHVHLQIECKGESRRIRLRSPLQIHNNTSYALSLFYRRGALVTLCDVVQLGETINPFENTSRIAVLSPDQTYSVPLYIAYHSELYVMPAHVDTYKVSDPIWWRELARDRSPKNIVCASREATDPSVFSLRILLNDGIPLNTANRSVPNYLIQIVPPLTIHNLLPYALTIHLHQKTPGTNEETDVPTRIESGEFTNVFTLNLTAVHNIGVDIVYMGITWSGRFTLSPDLRERSVVMSTDSDTDGGNKYLSLSILIDRTKSVELSIHAKYWIVNKTGLPIQLRGSLNSSVHEPYGEEPLLFCYRKNRRRLCRLRAYQSSWSSAFSLDSAGMAGLVICWDRERKKKYRILRTVNLSQLCSQLTKIITLLPYFIMVNETRKHLRYMEDNERADLWLDLPPGANAPFWPDTNSMRVLCKLRDSSLVSQRVSISNRHRTVLRMDKGTAICVEVTGGSETPFSITFKPYVPGCAPVRVDNLCEDLCLKLHQKELGQVALLNHLQSVLYTWDDPCAPRVLVWNVYNNKSKGYQVDIHKDGYGSERVSFHTVKVKSRSNASTGLTSTIKRIPKRQSKRATRQVEGSPSSSSSDDSETEMEVDKVTKRTRTDKVTVYWVSYLENQQRVLVFTQDERIARQFRQMIDSEKSNYEIFTTFSGIALSLCMEKVNIVKELMYASINDSPAIWEVNVAHKWKQLPIELSSWIEEKFKGDQRKCQLKDYINVDFDRMQMTKPFYGDIRRTYHPAIWLHYRKSDNQNYLHFKVQRFQIDNQLKEAIFPTVLYPTPLPSHIAKKTGLVPCFEFSALNTYRPVYNQYVYKYVKVVIQEFCLQLDKGFMNYTFDLLDLIDNHKVSKPAVKLRADLNLVHMPVINMNKISDTGRKFLIEYLHISPLKLQVSLSSRGFGDTWGSLTESWGSSGHKKLYNSDLLELLFNSRTSALTEIKRVKLKMAFFEVQSVNFNQEQLISEVWSHYSLQVLQQTHVLILGLDVLGNPYALLQDFTKGLDNLFYEPFTGCGTDPGGATVCRLAQGVSSLLGHTLGGAARTSSLLTHSLGDLFATLSFDEEYKKRRRLGYELAASSSFPRTLLLAGRSFFMGVVVGLSGVVMKPLLGAQRDGIEGFLVGAGRGLLGLLNRPAGGIADSAALVLDALRRASDLGEDLIVRARLPRYCDPYLGVRPYSQYEATGQQLSGHINRGHYSNEHYMAHASLGADGRTVVLITLQYVFLLTKCRTWGGWDIEWQCRVDDILAIPSLNVGPSPNLELRVRNEGSSITSGGERRILEGADLQSLKWLHNKLETVIIRNMEDKPCPDM